MGKGQCCHSKKVKEFLIIKYVLILCYNNKHELGIIISNTSFIKLFEDLKEYGVLYIITRKLNQDVVENLFSYLKGMAGSSNYCITALDFIYWFVFYLENYLT